MLEGPQQKRPRRRQKYPDDQPPTEDPNPLTNSDIDPTTMDVDRAYIRAKAQDPEGYEFRQGYVQKLWAKLRTGDFTYRDWNLAVELHELAAYHETESWLMIWRGGALAGHRQAMAGHWKFPERVSWVWYGYIESFVDEIVHDVDDWGQERIFLTGERYYDTLRVSLRNLVYTTNLAVKYGKRMREGTAIHAKLQDPPKQLTLTAQDFPDLHGNISMKDVISILVNAWLVMAWLFDFGARYTARRLNGIVSVFGTEDQKAAMVVVASYLELNRWWDATWEPEWLELQAWYREHEGGGEEPEI